MISGPELEALVGYAREAIGEALGGREARRPPGERFDAPGASFVTLRLGSKLIGCIGGLDPIAPLADDVRRHAIAAAFEDPRNVPLHLTDVERMTIEVSVLDPLEPIEVGSEEEALGKLRPGIDGVLLEWREYRSTFLPQVWESLPSPSEFLFRLKKKAGLPGPFWAPDIRLSRYTLTKVVAPGAEAKEHPC